MTIYAMKYPSGYYTYAYIRIKSSKNGPAGSPYYIGKGKLNRAWEPHPRNNGPDLLPSNKSQIIIMESNLTNIGALALERRYISWYGRIDNGTGILRNLTDGGDGTSGVKPSQTIIAKRAAKNRGRTRTPQQKKNISLGKLGGTRPPITEETRKKMVANNARGFLGKKHTEEGLVKIKLGRRLNPPSDQTKIDKFSRAYAITWPSGVVMNILNLNAFCRKIGVPVGNICTISTQGGTYKGFKCRPIPLDSNLTDFNLLTTDDITAFKTVTLSPIQVLSVIHDNDNVTARTLAKQFNTSMPIMLQLLQNILGFTSLTVTRNKMGPNKWSHFIQSKLNQLNSV